MIYIIIIILYVSLIEGFQFIIIRWDRFGYRGEWNRRATKGTKGVGLDDVNRYYNIEHYNNRGKYDGEMGGRGLCLSLRSSSNDYDYDDMIGRVVIPASRLVKDQTYSLTRRAGGEEGRGGEDSRVENVGEVYRWIVRENELVMGSISGRPVPLIRHRTGRGFLYNPSVKPQNR